MPQIHTETPGKGCESVSAVLIDKPWEGKIIPLMLLYDANSGYVGKEF